ncbi:MAG: hydroxyacylglutathione hydrolase [Proteobacteria bacterium]|nr:hydroxyacylglutathione hydrolase [Pseudomonadota bacterium]
MKIHQIYTNNALRNFTYIIEMDDQTAYVVDPWDAKQINQQLHNKHLNLKAIINTHEHWDHIQGNQELVDLHQCEVWAHANGEGKIPGLSRLLTNNEVINIGDNVSIEVLDTPGHSQAHLCFVLHENNCPRCVFSGDILFNAGVGNCQNGGNVLDLYETIQNKISTLPDTVIVYPGHDYLLNNLEFTLDREPNNVFVATWMKKHQQADIHCKPLTTTMADERNINTFLRLGNAEIINNLNIQSKNKKEVFIKLRTLRNNW